MSIRFLCPTWEELSSSEGFGELCNEYRDEFGDERIAHSGVQLDRYAELAKNDMVRFVAAYDGRVLAGVVSVVVTKSGHYAFPICGVESIYLRKMYRKGRTGLKLMDAVRKVASEVGAPGFTVAAPVGSKLERLATILGLYKTHSLFWCKL